MKEISCAKTYDITLLKGCAPHQLTSKIFVGRKSDDTQFVVKVPSMDVASPEFAAIAEDIAEEYGILKLMKGCPNIITCAEVPGMELFHVTVMCNCTMSSIFNRDTFKNISDKHRLHVLVGIANGISFIAAQGYVHGDISKQNVLFGEIPNFNRDDFSTPLIADFGYSQRLKKPLIEEVIDSNFYTVQHGSGLQAIDGLALFITDMFRFVQHVLLPVFGFSVCKSIIRPRKVAVNGIYGPSRLPNPSYSTAMDQLMLISEIEKFSGIPCIDPFKVPSDVSKFAANVVRTRVVRCAHTAVIYDGIVLTSIEALVRFPRGDVKRSPDAAWSDLIASISDMSTWPAKP